MDVVGWDEGDEGVVEIGEGVSCDVEAELVVGWIIRGV